MLRYSCWVKIFVIFHVDLNRIFKLGNQVGEIKKIAVQKSQKNLILTVIYQNNEVDTALIIFVIG